MAVQGEREDAYFTLLLTDSYLPGALVLAHSLRDAGTTKKLGILVTLDSISADVITQLREVYDYVFPVARIRNRQLSNLYLMNRPDLHSAFTKISLWKQLQFRKIVYVDSDVVAYRAPDELFDLPHPFAAAPDIGWPDLFNTGVMVLTPNMGDYYAMLAMAERGISFDGADQGLINMHFRDNYHRLSFTYNVTPSAHYQYVPAYRHFQSSINMVHFIGSNKPWLQGRHATTGSATFDEMVGRWWAVYDRHYRLPSPEETPTQPYEAPTLLVQYFTAGEFQPTTPYVVPTGEPTQQSAGQNTPTPTITAHGQQHHYQHHHHAPTSHSHHEHRHQEDHHYQPPAPHAHHQEHYHSQPQSQAPEEHHHHHQTQEGHHHHHNQTHEENHSHHHHHHQSPAPPANPSFPSAISSSFSNSEEPVTEAWPDQVQERHQGTPPAATHKEPGQEKPQPPMQPSWDAQWQPPPSESKPEAMNFPQMHYEMSSDVTHFVPPERYPSPPRNMWYEVPKQPPAPAREKPRPIFPWEENRPQASRVFASEDSPPPAERPETAESTATPSGQSAAPGFDGGAPAESSVITVSSVSEQKSEPATPTALPVGPPLPHADPWATFTLTNAWDDVPEIERYVYTLQKHRRGKASLGSGSGLRPGGVGAGTPGGMQGVEHEAGFRRRGSRLTDFPSEVERPSLPVTPAPVGRPMFWGGGGHPRTLGDGGGEDDGGEPGQHHHQLLPFAHGVPAQSDWDPVAQLQKLAQQQSELLMRKFGVQGTGGGEEVEEGGKRTAAEADEAATVVLSPTPVKPSPGHSPFPGILAGADEPSPPGHGRLSAPEAAFAASAMSPASPNIPEPSYHGPGVAWEKGEDVPLRETPMPPKEEDRGVLETR